MAAVLRQVGGGVLALAAADRAVKASEAQQQQPQQWSRVSRRVSRTRIVGAQMKLMTGVVSASSSPHERRNRKRAFVVLTAAGDSVETEVEAKTSGDVLPSHEWPENFSLLNFEDLISHYEPALYKADAQPGTYLADVMSKTLYTASPEQLLSEVDHFFKEISGVPVVDDDFKVIGVLSRKDREKAAQGEDPKVKELMSSPPITLSADKTVQDAAVLMLKNKIHRIPIVNNEFQVVGIVTRTDIFNALDGEFKSS